MEIILGDWNYVLSFTCENADGTPFDFTGYTIALKVWKPNAPGTVLLTGVCTSPSTGLANHTVGQTDFTSTNFTIGDFLDAEIQATAVGGGRQTFKFLNIKILEAA